MKLPNTTNLLYYKNSGKEAYQTVCRKFSTTEHKDIIVMTEVESEITYSISLDRLSFNE